MRKICLLFIILLFPAGNINADEISFPPELLWWINEVKKANPNIEVKGFVSGGKETLKFDVDDMYQGGLEYPVFMRWNYFGNFIAYYNYHGASLKRQRSGKYAVDDFDDSGILYIADRNKKVFFVDFFGVRTGLNAVHWLTDTILIGVGLFVNDDSKVDLFIFKYKFNNADRTVERTAYFFDNAFNNSDRKFLKLEWYKQRPDYFEID